MDGNDSLKRILAKILGDDGDDDPAVGSSSELPSTRKVTGDRYLSREEVDKWAKDCIQEMMGGELDPVRYTSFG